MTQEKQLFERETINNTSSQQALLDHVCRAITANRQPGIHFPGFYLGFSSRRIHKDGAEIIMPYGIHCADFNGNVNLSALATLADLGLGSAIRPHLTDGARLATLTLQMPFSGALAKSECKIITQFDGFTEGTSATLARASGTLFAAGALVCHTSGVFANPPVPSGAKIVSVPWRQMAEAQRQTSIPLTDMEDDELQIVKSAESALQANRQGRSFIERFWGHLPGRGANGGATNTIKIAPHMANRVGHLQGGILFGIAASTAIAALPKESVLINASAWYISAGLGDYLQVRSRALQCGKTVAVVLTEVIGKNGRLALEMITSHGF